VNGAKKVKAQDPEEEGYYEWYGDNDEEFIIGNCEAVKRCKTDPTQVDEPMWYAVDSIVGRFKEGRATLHQWAKSHPSYDEAAVDKKIDQALDASGPRTCAHIEGLWDGCKGCKFYRKVTSPIQLKSPDFISTRSTGFYTISRTLTGAIKRTPNYEDLLRFFKEKHLYASLMEQRTTRVWTGGESTNEATKGKPTHYVYMPEIALESFAQEHFKPCADTKMVKEFAGLVSRTEGKSVKWFKESTEGKLNLSNGVLNLRTRILSPHMADKFGFLYQLPFAYDPTAKAPEFEKFLHGISCGDKEIERAILQFLAYALSGERCVNEKILVMHGTGANGKSTLLRIMKALFGLGAISMQPEDLLNAFERRRLEGALTAVIEEMPSWKDKGFWELMKKLSSGDDITAAQKFKDSFSFENRAKFIITCNELPGGTDPSNGYFRRLLLVPFNASYNDGDPAKDPRIGDRIIANELAGVLNLILESYTQLTHQDFLIAEPKASREAIAEYREERDNVLAWAQATFQVATPEMVPIPESWPEKPSWLHVKEGLPMIFNTEAHQLYAAWCKEGMYPNHSIISIIQFGRRMKELFKREKVIFTQRKFGGINQRVIVGLLPLNFEAVPKK
jgi:P4 family phage/plasmid primase-like protien